jgi:hypothetical protein
MPLTLKRNKLDFLSIKHFQPILILVDMSIESNTQRGAPWLKVCSIQVGFSPGVNTPAYFGEESVTKKNVFLHRYEIALLSVQKNESKTLTRDLSRHEATETERRTMEPSLKGMAQYG